MHCAQTWSRAAGPAPVLSARPPAPIRTAPSLGFQRISLKNRPRHRCAAFSFGFQRISFKSDPSHRFHESTPLRAQPPAKASAAAAAAGDGDVALPARSPLVDTLTLGALFAGWYTANIYFNIFNKQVLSVFPFPLTATLMHFGIGSAIAATLWTSRAQPLPPIKTTSVLRSIAPLAAVHLLGNALTNISLGAVAPSFTHTIKAAEPLFSVALSAAFLGETPSLAVVASLLPIIAGVGLASAGEVSFNMTGFLAAMGSNLTFQSRNVLSKKLLLKGKTGMDNVNLFSVITVLAFLALAPVSLFLERGALPAFAALPSPILLKALFAGFTFHAYQQISYMILSRVSPVTHAVGNSVKRVVVIVASIIVFGTPVTPQGAAGTALALAGVFLYSQVKKKGGSGGGSGAPKEA